MEMNLHQKRFNKKWYRLEDNPNATEYHEWHSALRLTPNGLFWDTEFAGLEPIYLTHNKEEARREAYYLLKQLDLY